MKLETTARQLGAALRTIRPAIERRTTYPILACVLIDGNELRGTNLDMEIAVKVAATSASGKAAVDYHRLAALVAGTDPDATITLNGSKESVGLTFPGGRYDLPALDPDSFPNVQRPDDKAIESITIVDFLPALRFVAPSISAEETRYYLNGFCFSRNKAGQMCLVTTNGHQMSVAPVNLDAATLDGKIVPKFAVRPLLAMPAPDSIKCFNRSLIRFDWPGLSLRTKLIEDTFPNWQRVVPEHDAAHPAIVFRRAALLAAVRRLSALMPKGGCAALAFRDCRAALTGGSGDFGSGAEYLDPTNVTGEATIGFNYRFLRSLLSAFATDEVRLEIKGTGNPVRITAPGTDAYSILMPMRLSDEKRATAALDEAPESLGRAA